MNQVILIGRTTKDCELLNSQGATAYLRNSVAIKRTQKNENGDYDTDFFNFVAFGKTAEYLTQYCPKGSLIVIKGHLSISKITTDKGQIQTNDIICDNVDVLSRPQVQQAPITQEYKPVFENEKQKQAFDNIGIKSDISADDLPF